MILSGDRRRFGVGRCRWFGFDGGEAGLVQQFEAHVAAGFGPFVGLLGQHRTDQPDYRGPVREDPDDVGAPADLLVQPLLWVDAPMDVKPFPDRAGR